MHYKTTLAAAHGLIFICGVAANPEKVNSLALRNAECSNKRYIARQSRMSRRLRPRFLKNVLLRRAQRGRYVTLYVSRLAVVHVGTDSSSTYRLGRLFGHDTLHVCGRQRIVHKLGEQSEHEPSLCIRHGIWDYSSHAHLLFWMWQHHV